MFNPQVCVACSLEPQLGEGDPELRRPALLVDVRLDFPYRVESRIEPRLIVLGVKAIEPDAGCAHTEGVRRSPIEEGVERHDDVLRLRSHFVAPSQRSLNHPRVTAVHPRAHIEARGVVGEPDVHPFGRRGSFNRFLLKELGDCRRAAPRLVVETTVHSNDISSDRESRRLLSGATDTILGTSGRSEEQKVQQDAKQKSRQHFD